MARLRTAVIGLGRIGWQYHIPEIRRHPEQFELCGVCDPLAERRAEAKTTFGVDGYVDPESLFAAAKPDLVVIASPTAFHAAQTKAAFRHGIDVFCDKPVAVNAPEFEGMMDAMREHGRRFMVYQPHRVTAEMMGAREVLRRGVLGDIYMIKRACSAYVRRNDWQAFRKNGGGMLSNYGAHYVDQMLTLAGYSVRRTECRLRSIATLGDADDVVKIVLETGSGVIVDIDINMATALPVQEWMIFGTRGTAAFDRAASAWRVRYFEDGALPEKAAQDGLAAADRQYCNETGIDWKEATLRLSEIPADDFYMHVHAYFADGKKPFVTVEETRELMRTLDRCRELAGQE